MSIHRDIAHKPVALPEQHRCNDGVGVLASLGIKSGIQIVTTRRSLVPSKSEAQRSAVSHPKVLQATFLEVMTLIAVWLSVSLGMASISASTMTSTRDPALRLPASPF